MDHFYSMILLITFLLSHMIKLSTNFLKPQCLKIRRYNPRIDKAQRLLGRARTSEALAEAQIFHEIVCTFC